MARGGSRKPSPRTPPGGPGQYSRRTDGQQVATPGLSGDLQYGDVGKLEAAQKSLPLPAGTPTPHPQRDVGERIPAGSGPSGRTGGIPGHLLEMPPERIEPTTTGLDVGAGEGSEVLNASIPAPDLREQTLEYLYLRYRNNDAFEMLNRFRAERGAQAEAVAASPQTQAVAAEAEPVMPGPAPEEG